MRVKDKFLKKINFFLVFFIFFTFNSNLLLAKNVLDKLKNYNKNLKNTSAIFLQSNDETIEEGIIYFGKERIRIDYIKPEEISIVLSERKGMYINHRLEETEYFNMKKSYVKFFLDIFSKNKYIETKNIRVLNDSIEINETVFLDNNSFKIKIVYENNPIKLRKIIVLENQQNLEIGFFDHKIIDNPEKNFFSLINPYLN